MLLGAICYKFVSFHIWCLLICTDEISLYLFIPGFGGLNCEINNDECVHGYCANNSTCIDLVADYECICPSGFAGELSEASFS